MAKIWIIGDTHFGVRNNSKKWEELMHTWMDDFFFPLVDSEKNDDDILVHLGDTFDNRQSICLSTMNMAIEFFEKASQRFKEVWVLCGNHDAYYTTRNDVSSIECLKHIPKVNIVKEPTTLKVNGNSFHSKTLSFIPWTEDKNVFKNVVFENSPDIVFCHAEFIGCTMNASGIKSENDLEIPDIFKIYSGHIHHRQKHKNVVYAGSPYQLTQNDRNNTKGVWVYDLETGNEQFYFNDVSPEFLRLKYTSIEDMTLAEFKSLCNNKFVEIEAQHSLMSKCNFQKLLTYIQDDKSIMDISFTPLKSSSDERNISISDCVSITEMLDTYIDIYVCCDPATKKLVRTISKKLINE